MAHQSLYRRYRSQKFAEVVGQTHVTSALRTAVANGSYGHAYLFSGPRGTGKTSTARILAKALNCPNVDNGEPCGYCESCVAIEQGKSFDLYELDAASHNKVDDIRDLIAKVHLGSPGRTKVYILDEVHMLSSGAENALLKTLEEPPGHVVFVLATTEPHKVVPTIRSRTQHFQFNLLPADELAEHVRWVVADAGLDVTEEGIEFALRQGGGSARDTLSALDLVAAAGGVPVGSNVGVLLTEAIGAKDPEKAIAVIQEGLVNGQEPRVIGEATVETMRDAFLASMGASLDHLHDTARQTSADLAASVGPAALTAGMEALGQALVEMRQAPDPRIPLEVTVLRLARSASGPSAISATPSAPPSSTTVPPGGTESAVDTSLLVALQQRVDELERLVAQLTQGQKPTPTQSTPTEPTPTQADSPTPGQPPASQPVRPDPTVEAEARTPGPASKAREVLAQKEKGATKTPRSSGPLSEAITAPAMPRKPSAPGKPPASRAEEAAETAPQSPATDPSPPSEPETVKTADTATPPSPGQGLQTGTVTAAWGTILDAVSRGTRARFSGHQIVDAEGSVVTIAAPNTATAERCEERKGEVEKALSDHFGQPISLIIVVGEGTGAPQDPAKIDIRSSTPSDDHADIGPVDELEDVVDQSSNSIDRLTKAFPGSRVIEQS